MKSLLISFLFVFALAPVTSSAATGVLDIAHRGYAAVNPESTLQAFQFAIDSGADGLELDIRQSEDKVLLVTHEPVIAKIGNQRVENTQSKLAFLRTDIPSLEEVIILAKQFQKPLWIEIKQSHLYPGISQRLIALLKQYDYARNVVIQSFNHQDLLTVYKIDSSIPLLALFSNNFEMGRLPSFVELVGLPLSSQYADPSLVAAIHSVGKGVIFWRQSAAWERGDVIRRFIDYGADGFMLDRPLKDILNSVPW